MARNAQKEALIARLEDSRRHLGSELGSLREKLDVPRRVRTHIAKNPLLWFGGSAGAGLVASRLLRFPRRKKDAKKKSLIAMLVPLVFSLSKPWIRKVATREIQRRFGGAAAHDTRTRFPLSKPRS